jgi:hypothetical protein
MVGKMAELRCQMCGKLNPEHLNECKFCGARLKPLIASSGSKPGESETGWTDASQENTLDWLRSLGQEDEPLADSGLEEELPDWLTKESAPEGRSQSIWLEEDDQEGGFEAESLNEQSNWEVPNAEDNLTQWLSGEEAPLPSGEEEARLDDFSSSKSPTGDRDKEDLPAWLTDSEDEKTVPLSDLFGRASPEEQDWLKSLDKEDSFADWNTPVSPAEAATGDLPGWLTDESADMPAAKDDFDSDLPSWLTGGLAQSTSEPSSEADSGTGFEHDFPDWLDSLGTQSGTTGKLENMPKWIDEHVPSDREAPMDWLASLGDTPEEESPTGEDKKSDIESVLGKDAIGGLTLDPEDSFISDTGEDKLDWLQGLQDPDDSFTGVSRETPGFQASWGFDSSPGNEAFQETKPGEGEEIGIEDSGISTGLPSWASAFRPIEGADVAAEHAEGELERVGPLAGLRDLLTPEADIAKVGKLPSYSDVLQVSSTQRTNTQLLQALVESENIPRATITPSLLSSHRILRSIFGIMLMLLLLFPLSTGTTILPLPQTLPEELQRIEQLTRGAPADRPILVAFDYEPGLSGELEAASKALFNQWMEQGILLALVSTSPLGTGLGERQIAFLQSQFPYENTYQYGEDYVNLGYIAGGTAGLANFAQAPTQAVQIAFDNRPIWELLDFEAASPWQSSVLQPIARLEDFYMTVLLTDNPENARNWIEQVEPHLRQNSFVVITSTQAEPFIRPYFQNPDPAQRQVEGLLAGLRGGAAYEQYQGQMGTARLYWDAFGLGLLVAVGLLVLGGGYNYLDELRKVQQQNRRGKKST